LINNYGGLSNLELGVLTQETLVQLGESTLSNDRKAAILIPLEQNWNIKPTKIYSGTFETSLNGPGFSITLCNLTAAAKESKSSVEELLELLGAETKAPSWPNVLSNTSTKVSRKDAPAVDIDSQTDVPSNEDIKGRFQPHGCKPSN
jgi:dihydroxyacetone kinase